MIRVRKPEQYLIIEIDTTRMGRPMIDSFPLSKEDAVRLVETLIAALGDDYKKEDK